MKNVLVVAAHPDDEILGVGATAAKHVQAGDCVNCVILGEGQASRWNKDQVPAEILSQLHADTLDAARIIGYHDVSFADFPDNRFDSIDLLDIVKFIEKIIFSFRPNIVYTHHGGDLNIDHQITFQAVLTATRPLPGRCVNQLLTFETLSSTEWAFGQAHPFCPNVFIDVEKQMAQKLEAMRKYRTELAAFPHPRSPEGIQLQAQKWGCTVGKHAVEAFMLIRKLW